MGKEFVYKLKWQNGPLSGRELDLPVGEIRLGGEDPDIAIPLEQGATAILTTSAEGVIISAATADTPIWVDGRRWDVTQMLPLGVVIDLAGLALVLGELEAELPTLPIPARCELTRAESTSQRSSLSISSFPGSFARMPFWLKLGSGSLALTMGLLLTILTLWRPAPDSEEDPADWTAEQMRDPALSGLHLTADATGGLVLQGMCKSSSDVAALRMRLRGAGLHMRDESVCADTLRQQVRKVLELNGYRDVEVVSGNTLDTVEVHGAVRSDGSWQRTVDQLHAIRALRGWTVKNDHADMFEKLLGMLSSGDLLDGLNIVVSGKYLQISGQLDEIRANALQSIIDQFNNDGRPRLKASFQNIPSSPYAANVLPATVISVSGSGNVIYVELANGMRLKQGSILPSGYEIHALSRTAMALVKEQQLLSLPLDL